MPTPTPVWPERLISVVDVASAVLVGTRDAQLRPATARAYLARRGERADELLIFIRPAQAEQVAANLRDNGLVAVLLSVALTHETFQLKGRVIDIVDAPASDEPLMRARLEQSCSEGERMGVPRRLVERLEHWPALVIRVKVEQIFRQTPGPGAGDRVLL